MSTTETASLPGGVKSCLPLASQVTFSSIPMIMVWAAAGTAASHSTPSRTDSAWRSPAHERRCPDG